MPTISLTNEKLSNQIPSMNLPAGITCRCNAPCARLCYAKKGNFSYPNVKQSHINNLEDYKANPKFFFDYIINFLNNKLVKYSYFRWHSSGDIVDMQYLKGMCRVARSCKDVKFLCFTKKYELVNEYLDSGKRIPKNLKIVYSMWDKEYNKQVDNKYNMPTTYVAFKNDALNDAPQGAIPCGGNCAECLMCWKLNKGESVVFNQH